MFRWVAVLILLCVGFTIPMRASGEEEGEPPRYQTDGNVAPVLEGVFQGWGGTSDYFVNVDVELEGTHRVKCRLTARTTGPQLGSKIAALYPPDSMNHAAAILIENFAYFQSLEKKKGYRAVVAPLRDECIQFKILEPQSNSVAEQAQDESACRISHGYVRNKKYGKRYEIYITRQSSQTKVVVTSTQERILKTTVSSDCEFLAYLNEKKTIYLQELKTARRKRVATVNDVNGVLNIDEKHLTYNSEKDNIELMLLANAVSASDAGLLNKDGTALKE